ncbi:hypothetical protein GQ53DRAFT_433381 [Thozetella sp. PMI_491]|nr:hypothetical protein GQ53DRAFT_433381 [Thozetella sp. PMI_491]
MDRHPLVSPGHELSSEAAVNCDSNVVTEHKSLYQPWRVYWPPSPGSVLHLRFQDQFPEILSWRFAPSKPFERPWRSWLRRSVDSERNQYHDSTPNEERPLLPVSLPIEYSRQEPAITGYWKDFISRAPQNPQKGGVDLDDLVLKLQLPSVRPHAFNYLAPLDLYRREQLYKIQVPCFDGAEKSNLVSISRPVTIYDVSGYEDHFKLTESGFEFMKCPIRIHEWTEELVETDYLPRLADWLRDTLACETILVYAYDFRLHRGKEVVHNDPNYWKPSFNRAHCGKLQRICNLSCFARCEVLMPILIYKMPRGEAVN